MIILLILITFLLIMYRYCEEKFNADQKHPFSLVRVQLPHPPPRVDKCHLYLYRAIHHLLTNHIHLSCSICFTNSKVKLLKYTYGIYPRSKCIYIIYQPEHGHFCKRSSRDQDFRSHATHSTSLARERLLHRLVPV